MALYVLLFTFVPVASIAMEDRPYTNYQENKNSDLRNFPPGGVNMTSRVTPYQVRFGEDGRLRMDDFVKKMPCGHEEPATTVGQGDGYSLAPTTALYDDSQSPCVTYRTTQRVPQIIPVVATTISVPVRLDFTLMNPLSNLIEVRFLSGIGDAVHVVRFRRGVGLEVADLFAPLDIQYDESHRFWVTYGNGKLKVGLHGNGDPQVENSDPDNLTNEVERIELYSKKSTPTVWNFYEPCNS